MGGMVEENLSLQLQIRVEAKEAEMEVMVINVESSRRYKQRFQIFKIFMPGKNSR